MSDLRRRIRTTPRMRLTIDDALVPIFVGELLDPSPDIWIVSGWISDVPVLDNSERDFDALLGDGYHGRVSLSAVLGRIASLGSRLHVAVQPIDHNRDFVDRLTRRVPAGRLDVRQSADVLHEKTMCGATWVVSGSMNFTWRGIEVNEESVDIEVDAQRAAESRLDFEHRWSTP